MFLKSSIDLEGCWSGSAGLGVFFDFFFFFTGAICSGSGRFCWWVLFEDWFLERPSRGDLEFDAAEADGRNP